MVKRRIKNKGLAPQSAKVSLPNGYNPEQVENGVKALLEIIEKKSSKKKFLFAEDGEFVRIQVACVKIPKLESRNYRFSLPHGYLKDTSEVCLFVRDFSANEGKEYDDTVRHFKNLLSDAGVKSISEVMTVTQFNNEYRTYEMKRRLATRFDFILADSRISDWLHGCLGKQFHRSRKLPTPVRLHSKNLKAVIGHALQKTTMTVKGRGDNFMAKVGNTKQSVEQICENIEAFVRGLKEKFPGKWGNIRSIHIRTDHTVAIPIYFTIVNPNSVKVPKVRPRPETKKIPIVKGELSTLPDGYSVVVMPDGTVKVKMEEKDVEDLDLLPLDEEDNSEMDEEEGNSVSNIKNMEVAIKKLEKSVADSEEEKEEEAVEAAEEAYLNELSMGRTEKDKKRKSKGETVSAQKNTKKRKVTEKEPSPSENIAKKSKKVKRVKISMQWDVEDQGAIATKQGKNEQNNLVKSKNVTKNSSTIETSVPVSRVGVKAEVTLGTKTAKKQNQVTMSVAVSKDSVKKSKSRKIKKKSDA